ncbi:hypothetical protein A2U01_0003882 [Trifolium medium]|uniref:Reverse transcriptase Ty1/copia-type domain-containing protein n=1 Tax=Trifolium medium TaxID=97028 RepID=A0A392M8F5_9FABA|nr:hypothetical protein [Trifolium medium]
MQSLHKNKTWEVVPLAVGKTAIGCKWVYKRKEDPNQYDSIRYKARLVAKGFAHKERVDYNEIFSLMVKHTSIRVLLSLVAQGDLELEQLDMKTTFLHGDLDEEIYMYQPEGYKVESKESKGYIEWVIERFGMKRAKSVMTPLTPHFKLSSKQSRTTAEDKTYMICVPYASVVAKEHWKAVKWVLRYLKGTIDTCLCFGGDTCQLNGFVDSDYAGDLDRRRSTTGYVFKIYGAPVSWRSMLQATVTLSTTEAEYMTNKRNEGSIVVEGSSR